jgi:hypothetical protein
MQAAAAGDSSGAALRMTAFLWKEVRQKVGEMQKTGSCEPVFGYLV